ncbi:helix-turn-helix transcriptional regulator [Arthrobacter sp. StoSoilB22]|uniref:helix-turn-helix transcriptional regulator n=1 Tax=Arthrobacter sp. StoSoilB22 TaxID=2830996 RepID=UPI001CC41922|nr:helix-turn-helix transcriptional regulator [Arthrobacter sp. StoSoilB22]BCW62463.1 hypothetical protein StoSoilB22_14360 [Arthrobacter sp. StoSoilB22]
MAEAKRIETVIGENIRRLRAHADMSQAELGEKLGAILGAPWSRSTVSQAEGGKRAFVAAELVALSVVFRAGIQQLFRHQKREDVQISESYAITGSRLDALTLSLNDPMVIKAFEVVRQILNQQDELQAAMNSSLEDSRKLTAEAIDTLTFMHPLDLKGNNDA